MKPNFFSVLFFLFITLSSSFSQTAPQPNIEYDKKGRPNWVINPQRVFDSAYYLYGIGDADNQEDADAKAFTALIRPFGISVESSVKAYRKLVENNAAESRSQIILDAKISSPSQYLIGAKIYDRWEDSSRKKSIYYSVAVMNKPEAIKTYSKLIDANLAALKKIGTSPTAEKDLASYFRWYQNAARIANENREAAKILAVVDGPDRMSDVLTDIDYNAEVQKIAGSVVFEKATDQTIQRGETLNKKIMVSSKLFKAIGSVDCNVSVKTKSEILFSNDITIKSGDTFLINIPTSKLAAGNYTVSLELLLSGVASGTQLNPHTSFNLEIKPVPVVVNFEGDKLSESEKSTLSQAVTESLQKNKIFLQSGCAFVIMYKEEVRDSSYYDELILSDVSIALLKDGNVIQQSETKRITDIDKSFLLRLASKFIRENSTFWNGVKEALEK
jgi:hypothetical protein